ncbi:MAG: preprotein translocase subunit SecG [Prevotella sp.]|nr:preprotein translocase subunit SecG [Prevotella sp.]MCD8305846.1 preprotein translocase subunit SecG [Prevotella sp.]
MYTLLVILIVIIAILMIGIVLIQESKGGGLASNLSGGNQVLGVRKTTDVVEKTTWILAALMVVISVICAYVAPRAASEQSVFEGVTPQTEQTNPVTKPGFGADATPAAPAATGAEGGETTAPVQAPAAPATPAK